MARGCRIQSGRQVRVDPTKLASDPSVAHEATKAEASHEPPYIEQLFDEAEPHLKILGDLCVTGLGRCDPDQINALHGLWATFSKLPQKGSASCVGITKAILLLTNGRIGPAFDSTVRKKLGLRDHLRSSEEWVESYEESPRTSSPSSSNTENLPTSCPIDSRKYHIGRLYDMVLGPGTSPSPALIEPASRVRGNRTLRAIARRLQRS